MPAALPFLVAVLPVLLLWPLPGAAQAGAGDFDIRRAQLMPRPQFETFQVTDTRPLAEALRERALQPVTSRGCTVPWRGSGCRFALTFPDTEVFEPRKF